MKKSIIYTLTLVLLSTFVFTSVSCRSDEPNFIGEKKLTQEDIMMRKDPVFKQMKEFNDSLKANRPQSRGFWDTFKKICKVAFADIKGAAEGYGTGSAINPAAGWVGAVILGVGSSATAIDKEFGDGNDETTTPSDPGNTSGGDGNVRNDETTQPTAPSGAPLNDVIQAYYQVTNDSCYEVSCVHAVAEVNNLNLPFPEEHLSAVEIGAVHNYTLAILLADNLEEINPEEEISSEAWELLQNQEFISHYNTYINNPNSYSLDYALSDPDSRAHRIVQLFLDVYSYYPANMDDVYYVIREYISMVESDPILTYEEKQIVYAALATAAFSTKFWQERIE